MPPPAPPINQTDLAATMSADLKGAETVPSLFFDDAPQASPTQAPKPTAPVKPETLQKGEVLEDGNDLEIPESILPKAKKTEKKTVSKAVEDIDPNEIPEKPPGKFTEKQEIYWGELRAKAQKADETIAAVKQEYEAKIAELTEKTANLTELESKAKAFEDADRELAIHKIESSREYKEQVEAPLDAIAARMQAIAKKYEIDPKQFAEALEEKDVDARADMLDEIMTGMNSIYQNEVLQMARDTQELAAKDAAMRARAKEAKGQLEKINGEKTAAQQAEHATKYKAAVSNTIKDFVAKIPFVALKDGETAEAVFAAIEKQAKDSASDYADPRSQAFATAASLALVRATSQLRHLQAELKARDERLAQYSSATPSVRTGQQQAASAASDGADWYPGKG